MSEYLFETLLFYYVLFSYYRGVTMRNKFLEKVVKFFNVMGIVASSIYGLLIVLELLTEWYENGTLLRVWNL